jgi:hypothetical protein
MTGSVINKIKFLVARNVRSKKFVSVNVSCQILRETRSVE